MAPSLSCSLTIVLCVTLFLCTCSGMPVGPDAAHPAIDMTVKSHPMLASVFNTAGMAQQQTKKATQAQTNKKYPHRNIIGNPETASGPGTGPDVQPGINFLTIGLDLACRFCQESNNLTCMQIHCWNDGASGASRPAIPASTLPDSGVNLGTQGAPTQTLPELGGASVNVPNTQVIQFGVALPGVMFDANMQSAAVDFPDSDKELVTTKPNVKQPTVTPAYPGSFSAFMNMAKYQGKKAEDYVPVPHDKPAVQDIGGISEPVVGDFSGISEPAVQNRGSILAPVGNFKPVNQAALSPIVDSRKNVASSVTDLEHILLQLMDKPPAINTIGFNLQQPSGEVNVPTGMNVDVSKEVKNTPLDTKQAVKPIVEVAPRFPQKIDESSALGQGQGHAVQSLKQAVESQQHLSSMSANIKTPFQLNSPTGLVQRTQEIPSIVSMGQPHFILHNSGNTNSGSGGMGQGINQPADTLGQSNMFSLDNTQVHQVAAAVEPDLFLQGMQIQMSGGNMFPTTTFPTTPLQTMDPQRKNELAEVAKMFMPQRPQQ